MRDFKRRTGEKARTDGLKAENGAVLFLRLKGYKIVERNFKPPRGSGAGEIDIIAFKRGVLAFIEVKMRRSKQEAAEAVSLHVQERRIRGAEYFLSLHPEYENHEKRFDVILMTPKSIPEHIQNAFFS